MSPASSANYFSTCSLYRHNLQGLQSWSWSWLRCTRGGCIIKNRALCGLKRYWPLAPVLRPRLLVSPGVSCVYLGRRLLGTFRFGKPSPFLGIMLHRQVGSLRWREGDACSTSNGCYSSTLKLPGSLLNPPSVSSGGSTGFRVTPRTTCTSRKGLAGAVMSYIIKTRAHNVLKFLRQIWGSREPFQLRGSGILEEFLCKLTRNPAMI